MRTMKQLLDNITWHTLAGPHACFSAGTQDARRYAPGFSPIVGFADPEEPALQALAPYCEPGEQFYSDGWSGPAPEGWRIDTEGHMLKMLWEDAMPAADDAPEAVRLGPAHAPQALELALLTRPGPFSLRTIELGEYFGCFEGGATGGHGGRAHACRLAARDQRRVHAPGFPGPRPGTPADDEADPAPEAARRDALPACDERQRRGPGAV